MAGSRIEGCFPLYALSRRLFSARADAAAAWCWALHSGSSLYSVVWTWDTNLSALHLTLLLWATYVLDDTNRPSRWAAYGGLWQPCTSVIRSIFELEN